MGYKLRCLSYHSLLDVKADIHEDVERYFVERYSDGEIPQRTRSCCWSVTMRDDILDIVDKHFEKIER